MTGRHRCAACQHAIDADETPQVCPRCRSVYHHNCWDMYGGCVQQTCIPKWWYVTDQWHRLRVTARRWYAVRTGQLHLTVPLHIWLLLIAVFIGIIYLVFGFPMQFYPDDLPNYTPK